MHFPFKQSLTSLVEFKHGSWTLWLHQSIADQYQAIVTQLKSPQLDGDELLKREPHKRVIRIGSAVLKWQRYRDPRRLIKANVHANERLTRNAGGLLRTEWQNNIYLQQVGIDIPAPIGFAEQRHLGCITAQATITEFQPNVVRLKDHIDKPTPLTDKDPWLLSAIELANQLHQHHLYHLDFHHRNILFAGTKRLLIDNEKVLHTDRENPSLHAVMLGRLGFGLRHDPAEQARYVELAKNHINKEKQNTFLSALAGKVSGKTLDKLL